MGTIKFLILRLIKRTGYVILKGPDYIQEQSERAQLRAAVTQLHAKIERSRAAVTQLHAEIGRLHAELERVEADKETIQFEVRKSELKFANLDHEFRLAVEREARELECARAEACNCREQARHLQKILQRHGYTEEV